MIVTFYSFKGGVGRSMALVNVAELLADMGYRVMACDWDLEAPGLERYFADRPEEAAEFRRAPGVIDLLLEYKASLADSSKAEGAAPHDDAFVPIDGAPLRLRNPATYARHASTTQRQSAGWVKLLTAGQRDGDTNVQYTDAVRDFDWADFYSTWAGGAYIDFFRKHMEEAADIILIDSRTGVTEAGGVCTHQLADVVVLFSAANDQNIEGTRWMAEILRKPSVKEQRHGRELALFPIASRIERNAETDFVTAFRRRFEKEFSQYLPEQLQNLRTFIQDSEIPYIAKYSFSESILARQPPDERLRELALPYQVLAQAIVQLGCARDLLEARDDSGSTIHVSSEPTRASAPLPKGQFIFVSLGQEERAHLMACELRATGLDLWSDEKSPLLSPPPISPYESALQASAGVLLFLSAACDLRRLNAEINAILARQAREQGYRGLLLLEPEAAELAAKTPLFRRLPAIELPEQIGPGAAARIVASLLPEPVLIPEPDRAETREKLRANVEENSRFFFGRETELQTLLARTRAALEMGGRPVIISGAAGEGKTSLIKAALVPALRRGVVGAKRHPWEILNVSPSDAEPASLAARLRGMAAAESQLPREEAIANDPSGFGELEVLLPRAATPEHPLALIFDAVDDLALRHGWGSSAVNSFIGLLRFLAAGQNPNLLVVISIRASFLDLFIERVHDFLDRRDVFTLGSMSAASMLLYLDAAARLLGVRFEPGLVERIVADTARAGATSRSLRVVLARMCDGHQGDLLTHEAYAATGGIEGVTVQEVGRTLSTISDRNLVATRQIITSLVQPRTNARLTLARDSLLDLVGRSEGTEEALVQLFDWNVLVATEGGAITLASDAVPKLDIVQQWIRNDFERLKAQSDLDELARKWHDSGRPANLLPSGELLARFRNVPRTGEFTTAFLSAAEEADKRRQKRLVAAGFGVLAVVISFFALAAYGVVQMSRSSSEISVLRKEQERRVELENEISTLRTSNEDLIRHNAELEARLKTTSTGLPPRQQQQQEQQLDQQELAPTNIPQTANDLGASPSAQAQTSNAAARGTSKLPSRIYFETGSRGGAELIAKLAARLRDDGYSIQKSDAAEGEKPAELGYSEVKYYFPEDTGEAARLIGRLQSLGVGNLRPQPRQIRGPKGARPRHFDIWIEPATPAP